jgi:hypothetical protein
VGTEGVVTELLETAMAEASTLSDTSQDEIGRLLLNYIEKLRWLREAIDEGIRSLDAGEGRALDMEEFLTELHQRHAGQ